MTSYSRKSTPSDEPDLHPPSYAETAAKAREYGFVPEVLLPTTPPNAPSAPYPVSSHNAGLMPMPMPMIHKDSPRSALYGEGSAHSRPQPSRTFSPPRRDYQRMGTTAVRSIRTPGVIHQIEVSRQNSSHNPIASMCCVYITIILLVGLFVFLSLIFRGW